MQDINSVSSKSSRTVSIFKMKINKMKKEKNKINKLVLSSFFSDGYFLYVTLAEFREKGSCSNFIGIEFSISSLI